MSGFVLGILVMLWVDNRVFARLARSMSLARNRSRGR